jgi:DNA-binding GntR family transcriptional regulator
MTDWLTDLDPHDRRPQYVQIADKIERAVTEGLLEVGAEVPSGPLLAARYDVAVMTARAALEHLHSRGLISRSQGRRSTVLRVPGEEQAEGLAVRLGRIEEKLDRVLRHLERNE